MFPLKSAQEKGPPVDLAMRLKILTLKQMLWKLLVPFSEVQAGNKSENLLNKIRQIIYSLYKQAKLLKKCITI